jgi:hypothetical protein
MAGTPKGFHALAVLDALGFEAIDVTEVSCKSERSLDSEIVALAHGEGDVHRVERPTIGADEICSWSLRCARCDR